MPASWPGITDRFSIIPSATSLVDPIPQLLNLIPSFNVVGISDICFAGENGIKYETKYINKKGL